MPRKACATKFYHVEVDRHLYSAPHHLLHEKLDTRFTATTVELFLRGERITSHARSYVRGKHTTKPERMPVSHQKHAQWSPSRLIAWGRTIGESTAILLERIITAR